MIETSSPSNENQPSTEKGVFHKLLPWAAVLAIIAVLTSFLGYQKKGWTPTVSVSFPIDRVYGKVDINQAVSLDVNGKLRRGAGVTISKSVKSWPGEVMSHLHTSYIGHHLAVNAYDGYVMVTYINDDGKPTYNERFDLPLVKTAPRRPDDMVTLDDKTLVIIGTNELLPFTVVWKEDHAEVVFGKAVSFCGPTSIQPEIDNLNSTCVAMSYFHQEHGIFVTTRVACLTGEGEDMTLIVYPENLYSRNFIFHAMCCLSSTKYVLAKAIEEGTGNPAIVVQVATVLNNGTVTVGEEVTIQHKNFGFFDIDNLNDHQLIISFIAGDLEKGIMSMLIFYDEKHDKLIIGPYLNHQQGGASGTSDKGLYNFFYLRIMSETRFGVFYSNVLDGGANAFVIGEVTPANDLVSVGPEYLVAPAMVDPKEEYYWVSLTALDHNRLVLTEGLTDKNTTNIHAEMHVVDVLGLPIGIVKEVTGTSVEVVVSGQLKSIYYLEAGKRYYATNLGQLITGEYYGSKNTDSYFIYHENDKVIVSDDNCVGIAIDENTLAVETKS